MTKVVLKKLDEESGGLEATRSWHNLALQSQHGFDWYTLLAANRRAVYLTLRSQCLIAITDYNAGELISWPYLRRRPFCNGHCGKLSPDGINSPFMYLSVLKELLIYRNYGYRYITIYRILPMNRTVRVEVGKIFCRRDVGRKEGIGFYVTFNSLGHIVSCERTIDSPPQRHTFISSNQPNPLGDPAETQTCELMLGSQASYPLGHGGSLEGMLAISRFTAHINDCRSQSIGRYCALAVQFA